jgi:hypothetical protein
MHTLRAVTTALLTYLLCSSPTRTALLLNNYTHPHCLTTAWKHTLILCQKPFDNTGQNITHPYCLTTA